MSCEGYGLLISKWVDGEAKPEEASRAESHIATCAPCRQLAEEFRRNTGLVEAALGPEPFGHRIAGGVFGSIARREALWRWGARLGAAAAILLAVFLLRADRDAEQRRYHELVTAALKVVEQRQSELDRMSVPAPAPKTEIAWFPYPVYMDRDGQPVEPLSLPPAVADGTKPEPRPHLPEKRPGTVAQDRVDAYADYETGNVALSWNMDRVIYASLRRPEPQPTFLVYRRQEGAEDWGVPLNSGLLFEPKFDDSTARGLTSYEYRIVALAGGIAYPSDEVARVQTPPDLRVEFKGRGTLDSQTSFLFGVHVRVNGKWFDETFRVVPGEVIGGPRNGVDFSTGVIFRGAELSNQPQTQIRRLCSVIETPTGRLPLWAGSSALGSRDRLEADERPR